VFCGCSPLIAEKRFACTLNKLMVLLLHPA